MSPTTETALKIRSARPDISPSDALSIARLPVERVHHLRRNGLLIVGQVKSTLRMLRFLGEVA